MSRAAAERGPESALAALRDGLLLFAEGARFLRRERRLWALAVVPVLFALLFVVGTAAAFWIRLDWIHALLSGWLPVLEAGAWWTWLWVGPGRVLFWLLGWLSVLAALAVSLVAALLLANLTAAPFLDLLSQRVEELVDGRRPPDGSGASLLRDTLRSFGAELQRIAFLVGVWALLTGAGLLLPGAQLMTAPLLVVVTVVFLPLDYCGFALDRRGVRFRDRRRWLREQLPRMLGFGGVAFVASLVPGLNLLILPAMVSAGTLLVLRRPPKSAGATRDPEGPAGAAETR